MKTKMKVTGFLIALSIICLVASSVHASQIYDDFDGATLNSSWSIKTSNVSSWTYDISNSNLNVTDIKANNDQQWATVTLSQNISPALTDFYTDFDFSWDSDDSFRAIQTITLGLYNGSNLIASVGYNDSWAWGQGIKQANIAGNGVSSYGNPLPLSGTASVDITRTNGIMDIYWDSILLLSHQTVNSINIIALEFSFYPYGNISSFGVESVDLISPDPRTNSVPEPGTFLLLGSGIIGFYLAKRAKHRK